MNSLQYKYVLIGIAIIFVIVTTNLLPLPSITIFPSKACMVSFGTYNGHKYRSPTQTISEGRCLVESKWMRVMQHSVKIDPNSSDIINDWLFIDYHDRINVLVEDPKSNAKEGDIRYLVFKQSKYSLEGRESLAIVGGIIEPGESPLSAAKREVEEEMDGISCEEQIMLGRYRTDVNRGIGFVNSFLFRNCKKDGGNTAEDREKIMNVADEVGKPDAERQDVISMTKDEVKESVKRGEFLEVQWSNSVALAMLH
jgi:ADP-ribose pyrophosphatase YjhB (NUDIX family)